MNIPGEVTVEAKPEQEVGCREQRVNPDGSGGGPVCGCLDDAPFC